MKLFLITIYFLVQLNCLSQEKKHIVIKTNALHYLIKTGFNVSSEIQTKRNHSLNFSFEKGNSKYYYETDNRNKFVILVGERRTYWNDKKVLLGFFSSPYLKYRYKDKNLEYTGGFIADGGKFKAHSLGTGINMGYQNFAGKFVSIEAKIGLGIMFRITSKGKTKPTLAQPDGILGLSFGLKI